MKAKIIQILIVIVLVFSSYLLGKLSMANQLTVLNERIYQLETQIVQLKEEVLKEEIK